MKAKQGAIVAKLMTFFQRKCTLVIEMYVASFYRQKPNWDRIADFIYNDLCKTSELRKAVQDVQFHPVKMLLFIRFNEEEFRDCLFVCFHTRSPGTQPRLATRGSSKTMYPPFSNI